MRTRDFHKLVCLQKRLTPAKTNTKGWVMDIRKLAKGEPLGLGREEVVVEGATFILDTLGRVKARKSSVPENAPYREYHINGAFWQKAVKLLKGE